MALSVQCRALRIRRQLPPILPGRTPHDPLEHIGECVIFKAVLFYNAQPLNPLEQVVEDVGQGNRRVRANALQVDHDAIESLGIAGEIGKRGRGPVGNVSALVGGDGVRVSVNEAN